MRRTIFLIWLLVTCCLPALARAGDWRDARGKRIVDIVLLGQHLTPVEQAEYIELRVGDRFSIQAVRRSVKLLYTLGLFGQVRVTAQEAAGGVKLLFHLEPKSRVVSIDYEGYEAVSLSELRRLSRLQRGEEYDHFKLEATAADMLQLYRKRGYRKARIVSKADPVGERDMRIRYFIQEGEPTRISRISFRGQPVFSRERLIDVLDLQPGDVLDMNQLARGMARLRDFYRKENYLQARMDAPKVDEQSESRREALSITVQAGWPVHFRFRGNRLLRDRTLLKALKLENTTVINEYSLADLADDLADVYRLQGYTRVKIVPSVRTDDLAGVKLVSFDIDEGPRVTVRRVDFKGVHAFEQSQLLAFITDAMHEAVQPALLGQRVDPEDVHGFGGSPVRREAAFRVDRPQGFLFEVDPQTVFLSKPYLRAIEGIADLYRSQGYLEVQVSQPVLSYDDSRENLYITIEVEEGRRTHVESISFSGNQAIGADRLLQVAESMRRFVQPGGPLDLYGVEEVRKELVQLYARQGYIYCRVEQDVHFSEDHSLAEVQYRIHEGPEVHVRRILVRGNVNTQRDVFERSLLLRQGQVYSPEKATASRDDLLELGIFSVVDIKILEPDDPQAEKDVVVAVRERKPNRLGLRPGMSSAEGIRFAIDYTHENLFGQALEFVVQAKVNYWWLWVFPFFDDTTLENLSRRYQEQLSFWEGIEWWGVLGLHWPRVWWLSRNVAGRVDALAMRDHALSYDLTKFSIIPGLDYRFTQQLSFSLEAEVEYSAYAPACQDEPLCGPGSGLRCGSALRVVPDVLCSGLPANRWLRIDEGELYMASLRPSLSWDLRDNPFNPHSGALLQLRFELVRSFLSDLPVFIGRVDGVVSGYLPLSRNVTLALSARAGSVLRLSDESRTPSNRLFYLGGRNSIRGFAEEALIPEDLQPVCILLRRSGERNCISPGGNAFVTFKTELRFPLMPGSPVEGAVFTDLGNLWVNQANFNPLSLRPTAGLGIRLNSPMGPIGVDFGFNLFPDSERGEDAWTWHFNIGAF